MKINRQNTLQLSWTNAAHRAAMAQHPKLSDTARHLSFVCEVLGCKKGVVTLSEIGTINQQAKPLKTLASKLAVVGGFH